MSDLFTCKGENPYKVEEIVPDQVWTVQFSMEYFIFTRPEAKKQFAQGLGFDLGSEEFRQKVLLAAKEFGQDIVNLAKDDLKNAKYWFDKETITKEEMFNIPAWKLIMMVKPRNCRMEPIGLQ